MEARGGATAGQTGQGSGRRLRVTWVKSAIGYRQSQQLTIKSLGLRRLNQSVEHYDTPSIRGMLTKVHHLVRVDELPADAPVQPRGESGTERFQRRLRKKAAAYEAFAAGMAADVGSPSGSSGEAAAPAGQAVPTGAPGELGAAGPAGADEVTVPASQLSGTEAAASRLRASAHERSGAAGLAASGAAAVTAAANLAGTTGEVTVPRDQPGPSGVSGGTEATGPVGVAGTAAPATPPAAAETTTPRGGTGAAAPADLTGAPGGEDPVARVGGATEAGATAEEGNSFRERIGNVVDTVQERVGDAVDTAQGVVGGVVGIAVDRAQEAAGRAVDTVQERLDLEGSGPRSNDAVEAEAEDAAAPRRDDEPTD